MKIIVCDDYQLIVNSLIRDIHEIKSDAECAGFTDPLEALKNAFAHLRYTVPELDEDSVTDFYNGKNHLGGNIRRLRTEKGLSVSQLAEMLDVKQQTIYRCESGERVPDIVRFVMLSNIFGVETHELLK